MIRLIILTLIAAVWFYGVPLWDMFANGSRINTAMLHWMEHTWSGNLFMLIGIPMFIVASVKMFLPTKRPRR